MKFLLEIKLGNDAMQTAEDVARALRVVAIRVEALGAAKGINAPVPIRDYNGNAVGTWEFRNDAE